jgi:hypothetical protein
MVGVSDEPGFAGVRDVNATVDMTVSYVTELSVDVEAELLVLKPSTTELAAIDGITVPLPVIAVAATVHVILSVVLRDQVIPVAVPFCTMSDAVKLLEPTAPEKTTVKLIGSVLTGSD